MSGFVVAFGHGANPAEIESMLKVIEYRGPARRGIVKRGRSIMAQNYLRVESTTPDDTIDIPISTKEPEPFTICYDGQMGNWHEIAPNLQLPNGPFREERLFLELYKQYGVSMFDQLGDAIFSFVITAGDKLLVARDMLGIKTLFYGRKDGILYFASELKSILKITDDVHEFPPGHYMDESGKPVQYARLPEQPPEIVPDDVDQAAQKIRETIEKSIRSRIDFDAPTGSMLSGGLDSSVIALLGNKIIKEKSGSAAKLKTFALSVGQSEDLLYARTMSGLLDSEHHELIVDLDMIMAVLSDVIYYLESFDPSLVRSSVSNYLVSREAKKHGMEILLSGEGGDELFCGYTYLKEFPPEELFARQMQCMEFLHNNASLRLDRMNACNSVKVVAPLISGELLDYAIRLPSDFKQKRTENGIIEKWILRKAYENQLPAEVVWRSKQEFSQGSGSADVLVRHFEDKISDKELRDAQADWPILRSKEELYYFRIFTKHFGAPEAAATVGQWISL